jgi:6-phosphogluconolactonase
MKMSLFSCFLILTLSGCINDPDEKSKEILYTGTYSRRGSEGIYVFEFQRDSLKFNLLQTLPWMTDPSFLEIHPDGKFLYAIGGGALCAFAIDPGDGTLTLINKVPNYGGKACHVNLDREGRWAYISNYGTGTMVVYPVNPDGSAGDSIQFLRYTGGSIDSSRQASPHIHSVMVSADNRYVYVADLGTDRVMIYSIDHSSGRLSPASTPWASTAPGAGPRHFTFHPKGPYVYVGEELGSTTSVFKRDPETGRMDEIQRITSLPDTYNDQNSIADIHMDPEGKHLYVSNRGHNSLVIYSVNGQDGTLETEGFQPVRGEHPRNFLMGPRGEFVMVANRDTDNIVVFKRDPSDGSLTFTGVELEVPAPVCLKLFRLKSVDQ